jgi:hypothetical protein
MPAIKKFPKAPYEQLDYRIDYTAELAKETDTIASSFWIAPSDTVDHAGNAAINLTDSVTANYDKDAPSPTYQLGGTAFTNQTATIFVKGGALEKEYVLENRITTTKGRKYSRSIKIGVQLKSA